MNGLYEMYYEDYVKSKSKEDADKWIANTYIHEREVDTSDAGTMIEMLSALSRRDEDLLIKAICKTYNIN